MSSRSGSMVTAATGPRLSLAPPKSGSSTAAQSHVPPAAAVAADPLLPSDLAPMPVSFNAGSPGLARHILCYGDSLTAGYYSKGRRFEPYARALAEGLDLAGLSCKVSFCGHSGRTAEEMVHAAGSSLTDVVGLRGKGLLRMLEEDGPFDLVIIMAGTNDLGFGATHAQLLEWLRSLHAMCHDRGVRTMALAPPPAPCSNSAREGDRRQLLASIQRWCHGVERIVSCVDPADYLPMSESKVWDHDGLHFSPVGSRALGRGLAKLCLDLVATVEQKAQNFFSKHVAQPLQQPPQLSQPPPHKQAPPPQQQRQLSTGLLAGRQTTVAAAVQAQAAPLPTLLRAPCSMQKAQAWSHQPPAVPTAAAALASARVVHQRRQPMYAGGA